jgi:hypothetical protein
MRRLLSVVAATAGVRLGGLVHLRARVTARGDGGEGAAPTANQQGDDETES